MLYSELLKLIGLFLLIVRIVFKFQGLKSCLHVLFVSCLLVYTGKHVKRCLNTIISLGHLLESYGQ